MTSCEPLKDANSRAKPPPLVREDEDATGRTLGVSSGLTNGGVRGRFRGSAPLLTATARADTMRAIPVRKIEVDGSDALREIGD